MRLTTPWNTAVPRHLPAGSWFQSMAGTDQRTSDKPHDVQNHYAPGKPGVIYAGTQNGSYRSTNQGDSWEKLDYPKTGAPSWTFMFRPGDPVSCTWAPPPARSTAAPTVAIPAAHHQNHGLRRDYHGLPSQGDCPVRRPQLPRRDLCRPGSGRSYSQLRRRRHLGGDLRQFALSEDTLDLHGAQCSAAMPHTVFITTRQGPFIGPDRGSD